MGLDIYLYRYDLPIEQVRAAEAAIDEEESARVWADGVYENLTSAERDEIRQEIKDKYPDAEKSESISEPSKVHPDDICQIGYIRSSYNTSGMNSRLKIAIDKDLYWLFKKDDDEYVFTPNWEAALARCNQMIEEVEASIEKTGSVSIHAVSPNMFTGTEGLPRDEQAALAMYQEQLDRKRERESSGFDSYSTSTGEFHMGEPMIVRAIIPGIQNIIGEMPCVYVVTEGAKGEKNGIEWSKDSLEVIREMCEFVIAHPDRERMCLHWSG